MPKGRLQKRPFFVNFCNLHMSLLNFPAGESFLQRKVQPDQAKSYRDWPGWSAGMLRSVRIDYMLMDKSGVLF
jgi:hypothetical protein